MNKQSNKTLQSALVRRTVLEWLINHGVVFSNAGGVSSRHLVAFFSVHPERPFTPATKSKSELVRIYNCLVGNPIEGPGPSQASAKKKLRAAKKAVRLNYLKSRLFFQTDEWRTLRYQVLKKNGAACQCCGRCNALHGVVLHVDHIKPRSKFPELALDFNNLQVLCEDCNMGKSNKDDTDWRPVLTADDTNIIEFSQRHGL